MAVKPFYVTLSLIYLLFLAFPAIGHASVFDFITQLLGIQRGSRSEGILRLRNYLEEFGYLNRSQTANNSDYFDGVLESAIKTYQQNFHIPPSGILDLATVSTMITPRCGVPDIINGTNYMQLDRSETPGSSSTLFHIVSHYSFFPGNPRWPRRSLTYRFLTGFPTFAMNPVRNAFQKWTTATTQNFIFTEVPTNQASDMTLGFYRGSHGDNSPFDGRGGVLAHAYAPTNGRFHYDADEQWSAGPMPNFFDLETVAVHEIGHLLGLGHSQVREAIMYPSVSPGTTKNIQSDDIQGIRALYGF